MSFRIINQNFTCIYSLQESAKAIGFKSNCTQMGRGKLNSQLLIVEINNIIFIRLTLDKISLLQGGKPEGYLFFGYTLDYQGKNLHVHGYDIPKNYFYGLNPEVEIYSLTPQKMCMGIILIPEYLFFSCASFMGRKDIDKKILTENLFRIASTNQIEIENYLRQIYYLAEYQQETLKNYIQQNILIKNLLPLIINSLSAKENIKRKKIKYYRRIELVKQAQKWIQENLDIPITLQDIYSALNVSKRTLIYSFQDIFEMSPMSYVKTQRLNGVYRDLLTYDSSLVTVGEIARKWGFWSLGHFARDYQKMFPELPSQTIH